MARRYLTLIPVESTRKLIIVSMLHLRRRRRGRSKGTTTLCQITFTSEEVFREPESFVRSLQRRHVFLHNGDYELVH